MHRHAYSFMCMHIHILFIHRKISIYINILAYCTHMHIKYMLAFQKRYIIVFVGLAS